MPDPRFLFTLPGVPRRTISRLAGRLARLKLPLFLRRTLWLKLATKFGMDPATLPADLGQFKCFLDLFCRELPKGCRPLDEQNNWLAPSDGLIVADSTFSSEGSFLIKGCPYSAQELVPNRSHQMLHAYRAVQIYLAPRDYHRYHAPCDLTITSAESFPGDLQPVDPSLARRSLRVLAKNRRVLLNCRDAEGDWFALIFIGALNVGEMRFCFDPSLGLAPIFPGSRNYDPLPQLRRGQELGRFEFGSTVLMIVPPKLNAKFKLGDRTLARVAMFDTFSK